MKHLTTFVLVIFTFFALAYPASAEEEVQVRVTGESLEKQTITLKDIDLELTGQLKKEKGKVVATKFSRIELSKECHIEHSWSESKRGGLSALKHGEGHYEQSEEYKGDAIDDVRKLNVRISIRCKPKPEPEPEIDPGPMPALEEPKRKLTATVAVESILHRDSETGQISADYLEAIDQLGWSARYWLVSVELDGKEVPATALGGTSYTARRVAHKPYSQESGWDTGNPRPERGEILTAPKAQLLAEGHAVLDGLFFAIDTGPLYHWERHSTWGRFEWTLPKWDGDSRQDDAYTGSGQFHGHAVAYFRVTKSLSGTLERQEDPESSWEPIRLDRTPEDTKPYH